MVGVKEKCIYFRKEKCSNSDLVTQSVLKIFTYIRCIKECIRDTFPYRKWKTLFLVVAKESKCKIELEVVHIAIGTGSTK